MAAEVPPPPPPPLLLLLLLLVLPLLPPPVAVQLAMRRTMVPTYEARLQPCRACWALPSTQPKHGIKKGCGFRVLFQGRAGAACVA